VSGYWIAAFVALWVFVVVLAAVVLGVLQRVLPVLENAERRVAASSVIDGGGLPLLSQVPDFKISAPDGGVTSFTAELAGTSLFLLLSTHCDPCRHLAAELAHAGSDIDGVPVIALVDTSRPGKELQLGRATQFIHAGEAAAAFQSTVTPHVFLVHETGRVLERLIPGSLDDLRAIVTRQRGGDAATLTSVLAGTSNGQSHHGKE
jgi:hypothetical protein